MVNFRNVPAVVQIEMKRTTSPSFSCCGCDYISITDGIWPYYLNRVIVRFQSMSRRSSVTFSVGYETGEDDDDIRWRGEFCGVTFFSLKVVRDGT